MMRMSRKRSRTLPTSRERAGWITPPEWGGEGADRQRGDGGGVQGDRQAAVVWLGDEVDGGWSGGGVESAGPELYTGAVESVLVEGRSVGVPGRRLSDNTRLGRTSISGQTLIFPSSGLRHPTPSALQ